MDVVAPVPDALDRGESVFSEALVWSCALAHGEQVGASQDLGDGWCAAAGECDDEVPVQLVH